MINLPKTKLLFFDLETVGIEQDFKTLKKNKPELAKLFESYQNWIVKRYPEEEGNSVEDMFYNKAALIPEFAKIIVASFAFYAPDGNIHKQTFSSDQEIEVLQEIKNLFWKYLEVVIPLPLKPSQMPCHLWIHFSSCLVP